MTEKTRLLQFGYSIAELSDRTSLSKAFLRNEIKAGRLIVNRYGRRLVVLHENVERFLSTKHQGEEK